MRSLTVAMDDLLDAVTPISGDPYEYLLDLQTGAVIAVPGLDALDIHDEDDEQIAAVEAEPERYADIPRIDSRTEYDWMVRFAEAVRDTRIREQLEIALDGKGAFGRFRSVLNHDAALSKQWALERRTRLVEHAKSWLASLDIEPEYSLRPLPR